MHKADLSVRLAQQTAMMSLRQHNYVKSSAGEGGVTVTSFA